MRAIDDRRLMMREEDTSGIRRDDTVVENRNFSVADEKSYDKMEEIFRALANKTRLLILKEISYGPLRISELSRKIGISNSNVLFHIEQLRKAGLLLVDFEPSRKGFAQVVYPAHILNLVCNIRGDNREGDIAEALLGLEVGITLLNGEGAFTGRSKKIILCVMRKSLYPAVRDVVRRIDKQAFMIVSSANEVFGEGFKRHDSADL